MSYRGKSPFCRTRVQQDRDDLNRDDLNDFDTRSGLFVPASVRWAVLARSSTAASAYARILSGIFTPFPGLFRGADGLGRGCQAQRHVTGRCILHRTLVDIYAAADTGVIGRIQNGVTGDVGHSHHARHRASFCCWL